MGSIHRYLLSFLPISILVFHCQIGKGQSFEKNLDIRHFSSISKRSVNTQTENYDICYHRFDLKVNPSVLYIQGSVTTFFKPLSSDFNSIEFDFRNNMVVDSIKFHGNLVSHSFLDEVSLSISLGTTLPQTILDSIQIFYHGVPLHDGFGAFSIQKTPCGGANDTAMWTLSEPYGAKNWWPCKESLDDKADSIDMKVTCPAPYRVGSNGLLTSEITNGDGTKTYLWKHRYPIATYLVAFAAAKYAKFSNYVPVSGSTPIEILNYIYPCDSLTATTMIPDIIPMFTYYHDLLGVYPFKNEKYGHAQCGFGGGMEHTTMTFLGSFGKLLLAHELAHQWFGDKITCGSWNDIWLNEGFATFMEGLTCEQGIGASSYYSWKADKISNVTSSNFGSTYVTNISNIGNIFNGRLVYNKGSMILHMLRWKLGDTDFFSGLHNYINDTNLAYDFAHSDDFKSHMEAASGQDLTEYFNDWLYGEGWPFYNIKWSFDATCNVAYANIQQTHSANMGTFFEMPIPIRFSDGVNVTDVVFDQNFPDDTLFTAKLNFVPTSLTFDPNLWLCAKKTVTHVAFNNKKLCTWNGGVSNDWFNASNWDCGIPSAMDDVFVPFNTSNVCTVPVNNTAQCHNLKMEKGATMKVFGQLNCSN